MLKAGFFLRGTLILLVVTSGSWGATQDTFTVPLPGCRCPEGYVPFRQVCVDAGVLLHGSSGDFAVGIIDFERKNQDAIRRICPETVCDTEVRGNVDDIVVLDNDAIVELRSGSVRSRDDAILYRTGTRWHLFVEGEESESVDLIREPRYCATPTTYPLLNSSGETFQVGGQVFDTTFGCYGWRAGDRIVNMDAICVFSTVLLNVTRGESCEARCR